MATSEGYVVRARNRNTPAAASAIADHAAAWLKPLVARAGAVINGDADASLPNTPQMVVDGLMKR